MTKGTVAEKFTAALDALVEDLKQDLAAALRELSENCCFELAAV